MDPKSKHDRLALVADIGGTNARFAIANLDTLALSDVRIAPSRSFASLPAAASDYISQLASIPKLACFALAGPIAGDTVRLTNLAWSCTRAELQTASGVDRLIVMNDFEALALVLPHLQDRDLHAIGSPASSTHGVKAVLGPGTGLGVAGLVPTGERWMPLASEGGHISFAARDASELSLLSELYPGLEHISAERLLSGSGLARLYAALGKTEAGAARGLEPSAVVARARSGSDAAAEKAIVLFSTWLARFAGDVALLFGARGGLYLAGGIAPNILFALTPDVFRSAFEAKGRLSSFLAEIPVNIILAPDAGLRGAAVAASAGPGQVEANEATLQGKASAGAGAVAW